MSSDLDALVESVRLSLHAPSPAACDQLDSAVATFALTYSAHPPAALFAAVHATRSLVASAMSSAPETLAVRMMDAAGWLSALLGNLSYHLDARPAAATHWAAAAHLAAAVDDRRLTAWTRGAQAMLARADGDPSSALDYANDGLANAADPTQRAQLLAWGVLPSLAELGRESDAAEALGQALDSMDSAEETPGRFGFDGAELHLHAASAYLSLGNSGETVLHANTSAKLCQVGRPGWAAAVLTAAQGHAVVGDHLTAAHIAHDVLDQVPPERLRATSRTRLAKLCADTDRTDLIDRVHALPPLVAAN